MRSFTAAPALAALALSTSALAGPQLSPQQTYDACLSEARKAFEAARKSCASQANADLRQRCEQRAANTDQVAQARCVATLQRAVNLEAQRAREAAARAARRNR